MKVVVTTDVNGNGERNVAFSVDVPDDIDASGPPYELVAKLKLVRPDGVGYQTNMVELHDVSEAHWLSYNDTPGCAALGDDCHCVLAQDMDGVGTLDYACMTRHGKDDLEELPGGGVALRQYNGDLCVVPGGEQSIPLGFIDAPPYTYAAHFLGGFQNASMLPSHANFSGRRAYEDLSWTSHECFDRAAANGWDPGNRGCGLRLPGWRTTTFVVPTRTAEPGDSYGSCLPGSFDTIGFNDHCAERHSQRWDSGDPSPCSMRISQRMSMACREHPFAQGQIWYWIEEYTQPQLLDWSLDSTSLPAQFWSSRDGAASQARAWGGSAQCVEADW